MGLIRWLVRIVCYGAFAIAAFVAMSANNHHVLLKFDPFNPDSGFLPPLDLRLSFVIVGSLLIGFLAGGVVMWFLQGKHRKRARALKAETQIAERQLRSYKLTEKRAERDEETGLPALTS